MPRGNASQPTQHIAVPSVAAHAACDETRAIPSRVSGQGAGVADRSFSSQPTAARPAVPVASPYAEHAAAPSATAPMPTPWNKRDACGNRDPFEPSTPDPAAYAQANPYAPGSTEPVATRYSEKSHVKKSHKKLIAAAIIVVLVVAFGLFHAGGTSKSTVAPEGGVTQAQRETATSSSSISTPGVQQNAATLTVDTSDLVGEKWSNAKKKLEVRGADVDSIVVLTDDGKSVWDASNWTVASIAVEDGALTAHLTHDSGSGISDAVSDAMENGAADAAGGVLDAAGEAVRSAGENAAEGAKNLLGSLF